MNRLQNLSKATVNECVISMVKFVIGGGYTKPRR